MRCVSSCLLEHRRGHGGVEDYGVVVSENRRRAFHLHSQHPEDIPVFQHKLCCEPGSHVLGSIGGRLNRLLPLGDPLHNTPIHSKDNP
jgi:hypothetical protein